MKEKAKRSRGGGSEENKINMTISHYLRSSGRHVVKVFLVGRTLVLTGPPEVPETEEENDKRGK